MNKLLPIAFLLCTTPLWAQEKYAFYLGSGTSIYYGDLSDTFTPSLLHGLTEIGGSIYFTPGIGLRSRLAFTRLSGADSLALSTTKTDRNLSFRTAVSEISCMGIWELRPDNEFSRRRKNAKPHFTPYITAGVALLYFDPKAYYNGEWIKLHPLGTEGQYIKKKDSPHAEPYSRVALAIPMAAGLSLRYAHHWGLSGEMSYRYCFSDYLDDVSARYPQRDALLAAPNGITAVALSDRSRNGIFHSGSPRGNPKSKDSYFFFTIGLNYFIRA